MSEVTLKVSNYIKTKGINLAKVSRDTGISYSALYNSLMNDKRPRDLRDDEFLKICVFLDINPNEFAKK